MSILRDRNGEIYKIELNKFPPPSNDKVNNAQFYINKELSEIINFLLDELHDIKNNTNSVEVKQYVKHINN